MIHPRRDTARNAEAWFGQFWKLLIRLALIAFAGYFLWRVHTILNYVLAAAVLAFALIGPVDWLCRSRVKGIGARTHRLIATLLVFFALGYVVFASAALMISPFVEQIQGLSANWALYQHKVADYAARLQAVYAALPPDLKSFLQSLMHRPGGADTGIVPMDWLNSVLTVIKTGIAGVVDIILVPVLAFYFVLDGHSLRNEFLALVPRRRVREAFALLRESSCIMRTYIIAQLWLCVIAGVVVTVGLSLVHMPYALVLGLLAGVTRAIPIIGPIIGGIPIVLLAAVLPPGHHGGIALALKVLVFFSALHLFESKLLMPKFIGHRIHLHAVVVILALLIGAEFFGLPGMFLAAPLAAIGRTLIGYYVIRPRRLAAQAPAQVLTPHLLIKTQ